MRKRVPLNAIRAVEAAARRGSVAKAADELCVTPTAVSHQIRQLEDFLQTRLFIRRSSRIELGPGMQASMKLISTALDLIGEAVTELQSAEPGPERLTVGASASVGPLWLMPHLSDFLRHEPDVEVSLRTYLTRREAETQQTDVFICNWAVADHMRVDPLIEEDIIPVCTPELAARHGNRPADILRHVPLIHVDRTSTPQQGSYPDWERYLREYGVSRHDTHRGPRFNQASAAIEAARAGTGALLGRSMLIERLLRRGELIRIAESYPVRGIYYLVAPRSCESPALVDRFRDWIVGRVRGSTQLQVA